MNTKLTNGQVAVLVAATLPMIGAGGLGAWGTYTNISAEFGRAATALGVVAAGEGVTLVLALVMVGLTMLGQAAPLAVRAGLWAAPIAAAAIGVAVADNPTEAVVYGLTPMGMTASAEGLGLLARRIVVHRTGVDAEAQRRNAETVQQLAWHRARAANHPSKGARKRSERASWRLAKRVGVGDAELGARLVEVQRERLREGADAALVGMFGISAAVEVPELPAPRPTVKDRDVICSGPGGALPLRRPKLAEVTTAVPIVAPKVELPKPQVVVTRLDFEDFEWKPAQPSALAASLPAEEPRQVVTSPVADSPSELRRKARRLHRQVVAQGGRGVTVDQLRDQLGLSRRDATALRREVVEGVPR